MTDHAETPVLRMLEEAQQRLEQLHTRLVQQEGLRVTAATAGLPAAQVDAMLDAAAVDLLERASRELLEEIRAQLRRDASTAVSAGVPKLRLAEALGRSRTIIDGWLKPR